MGKTRCCILLLGLFWATQTMVEAQCDGTIGVVKGSYGTIQSPNYGLEYGKSANCSWEFDLPMTQKAYLLTQTVTSLKTYFVVSGEKICPGPYNLAINNDPATCERYVYPPFAPSYCNAYFSSPACQRLTSSKNCEVSYLTHFPIRVIYVSNGKTDPNFSLPASASWGFKMEYNYTECSTDTSTTIQKMVTTTVVQGNGTEFVDRTTKINPFQNLPTTSVYKETSMHMSFTQNGETSTKHEPTTRDARTRSPTKAQSISFSPQYNQRETFEKFPMAFTKMTMHMISRKTEHTKRYLITKSNMRLLKTQARMITRDLSTENTKNWSTDC